MCPSASDANDGNLSIPLYVRGKTVSNEKGVYNTDGLNEAVKSWEESSKELQLRIDRIILLITQD